MKIGTIDLDREVLVIAEIGNNHEGNVDLAEQLVELAAEAGAQAVKFQTIAPDRLVAVHEKARLRQLSRFALTPDDHERLARVAERAGVMFLSTPFFIEAVSWLDPLVPAFKIASGDNDFSPLLAAVAETGKPIILSTGMTDIQGVRRAKADIDEVWSANATHPGLALLHCVSSYPAQVDDANVSAMNELRGFADAVGYSDHTLGIEAASIAVAAGARVIEKHFTISKTHSDFRDHQLSADPDELRALVKRVQSISSMLGEGRKTILDSELPTADAARRSIVARRDLPKGHQLCLEDLDWLRPAGGLSPALSKEVVERTLNRAVRRGERLSLDLLV